MPGMARPAQPRGSCCAALLVRPCCACCRLRQLKTARKLLRDFNTAAKVELEQQVAAGQAAVQQLLQLRQDLDAAYACIRCAGSCTGFLGLHRLGVCPHTIALTAGKGHMPPCCDAHVRTHKGLLLCSQHVLSLLVCCRSVKQQLAEHHPQLYSQLQQELAAAGD